MKTHTKLAVLIVAVIGTLVWLAVGGINEAKTYYKTIAELDAMGARALGKRLRVAGDVEEGSITRRGASVRFTLTQGALELPVVYEGVDPLPDTFKDSAQAVADGKMAPDGVFHANKIQAKCASKYQARRTPGTGGGQRAGPR